MDHPTQEAMTLEEIKDQVTKNDLGWSDYYKMIRTLTRDGYSDTMHLIINEIAKRYATECVKASLEEAAKNAVTKFDIYDNADYIVKESITNPRNIVFDLISLSNSEYNKGIDDAIKAVKRNKSYFKSKHRHEVFPVILETLKKP
jgi:hypothetical protein